ncbi:hypothetical protein [Capnocytophaga stomatis]|uniref:Secreted protein n=1 Tax=Capnocytophaga stomatis TaxID=1848904 RepID=A0ABW8Q8P9_9FLAO|nr:hypothetical protein [Capnocytophaga stomatis]GIJ96311.1 hypothetical protein CAPN001_08800 [Capnocytophaga stomatis]GIM49314.1 hypothetical protein CAPN003_07660 [Capnocytophaga stomatis]
MKKRIFVCLFGFVVTFVKAQTFETSKKEVPVVVPLENAPELNSSNNLFSLPLSTKKDESGSLLKKPEKEINFTKKSDLIRRKVDFKPNYLNDYKREEYDAPKGNQFFGDFVSNGGFVNVYCRDFQAIDGDRVSILVNDKVEIHDILLLGEYAGFQINLKPGFNKIEFLALNQGESGPNTADFRVLDDSGKIIAQNQWNLATGSKAQFVIIKEVENQK